MIKESLVFKEDLIEGKSEYPYLTVFKKEPFRSFVLIPERYISSFYISKYNELVDFFSYFNKNLLKEKFLNLENIFWFLLLKKYLKIISKEDNKELYDFIIKCEMLKENNLGFKFSPFSTQREPDIWSTYFALSCMKLLGLLDQYLLSKGHNVVRREIKDFLALHNKGNVYLHCLDKQCEICQKTTSARTIYFTLEILHLLGIDTRLSKDIFRPYLSDKKRDPEIIFKILSLKYLDLDVNVRERTIQYLNQFQKENGGFSFKKIEGRINTTFWVVYTLDLYSWLLDYDPISIYPFINSKINVILNKETYRNLLRMMELSKLVILLSIIWRRFIDQIEREILKNLESDKFVDLDYIISSFGLTYGIEDVISYINKFYTFNLRILDNHLEFTNHIHDLSPGMKAFLSDIYEKIKKNGIAKLPSMKKDLRKLKSRYFYETFKFKEDIMPIVNSMIEKHLFKNIIKRKKKYYLSSFLKNIIVSDTEIKTDRLFFEKDKAKDIKNDIFNMVLKLKNASLQIKEEIESYLILEEILLAKERLRYVIRDSLMEADFLNENIENSFNEDLYYIDFQSAFESEISRWNELYTILSKKLKDTETYLSEKIAQKEEFRNLNNTLDNLQDKIFIFNESIDRELNRFRENLKNIIEEFTEEEFSEIIKEFEKISTNIIEFDKKLYEISQKIVSKESEVIEKRKRIVDDWIVIKEEYNETINYYSEGFLFFRNNIKKIDNLKHTIVQESQFIHEKAKKKAKENQFKDAFNIIKSDSDILLKSKTHEIKELRANIKIEINSKQKLYLLYKQLLAKLDLLEENLVTDMSLKAKSLKNKVMEERNRAKIEDFDNFISHEIMTFKELISASKESLVQVSERNIKKIIDDFDLLLYRFNEKDKEYSKKLNHCREIIENFDDKSNLTIIQWENFKEYLKNEINILKEDYINKVISEKINSIANKKKTNYIKVIDLKKDLGLKCRVLMDRIKDMIEISKLNAKLFDTEKCVLLYTPSYYKNKELKNFIDNKLLKIVRERIGKILALYDSSIRNKTLNVNLLELQNRIKELDFKEIARVQFENKVKELNIDQTRSEFIETNKYFNSIIENNILAINNIQFNLKLFNDKQNSIIHEFNYLKSLLKEYFSKIVGDIDKKHEKSYFKVKQEFGNRWNKIAILYEQVHQRIEKDLKLFLSKNKDTKMLSIELREFFVKKKSIFFEDYEKKKEVINGKILILKDETFRGELIKYINERKIKISQMLGMLQSRVEDDIEAREYKRAYLKIQKREKDIKSQIKFIRKSIKTYAREFNKYSIGFETKNKHILEEFEKFIEDFIATLMEKVKSLEQLILKSYVNMAIKAVANEFLTVGFLNNELKIKKQNLQEHLIYLISSGDLKGKFDLRLNIYYENPELLEKLNEDELEAFKKINFRVYTGYRHLKNFLKQNYIIFAFLAAILSITYTLYQFTGGNTIVFAFPIITILLLLMYFFLKREKEEKVLL